MNTKIISIIIGLVLALGTGTLVYSTKKPVVLPPENAVLNTIQSSASSQTTPNKAWSNEDEDDEDGAVSVTNTTSAKPVTSGGISLAQIAQHASRTSCWSVINGSVYDLTSWIPNHPGGERVILSLCGVDGSSGYNGQHSGSTKTARILGGFKLGALVQ